MHFRGSCRTSLLRVFLNPQDGWFKMGKVEQSTNSHF